MGIIAIGQVGVGIDHKEKFDHGEELEDSFEAEGKIEVEGTRGGWVRISHQQKKADRGVGRKRREKQGKKIKINKKMNKKI